MNETSRSKEFDINDMVDKVFKQVGKDQQGYLTLQDFKTIMLSDTADVWKSAVLNLEGNVNVTKETWTLPICIDTCYLHRCSIMMICKRIFASVNCLLFFNKK